MTTATPSTARPLRQELLHLFVLNAFAVAQPLFDLLGRYATFFVAHAAGPRDIALFAMLLCTALPAVLALVELAFWFVAPRARRAVHLVFVAALVAVIILPPLHRAIELPPAAAFAVALGAGTLAAWAYARWSVARTFVTALSPALILFPALFLFASPVAPLLRPPPRTDVAAREILHPAPVVVVIFDEFTLAALLNDADAIDAVRYPNFAALANTSTWYRNATSVADYTPLAVPAILTGTIPDHGRVPTFSEHPRNLFTLLGGAYDLSVSETITELCPPDLCRRSGAVHAPAPALLPLLSDSGLIFTHALAPPALRAALPDIQRQWSFQFLQWTLAPIVHAVLEDRAGVFRRFVSAIQPSERPGLWFLHVLLPHYPYQYLPSGVSYDAPTIQFGTPAQHLQAHDLRELFAAIRDKLDVEYFAEENREAARLQHLRYLKQVQFVDRLLGELLSHLHQVGMFDKTLLVVTADHGVCLRAGCSPRFANESNLNEIMSMPLFIKMPGQREGRVDDRDAETIDILPTIADALGIVLPWPVDGVSLQAGPAGRSEKALLTPLRQTNMLDLKRLAASPTRPRESVGLANQLALFGANVPLGGEAPDATLATLVDRPVDGLRQGAAAPFAVAFYKPEAFGKVDRRSQSLPAFVRGQFKPTRPPPPGMPLAIAVNGVVRAVTLVLPDSPTEPSFGALISEAAWRDGANQVELFAVEKDDGGLRLAAVPSH